MDKLQRNRMIRPHVASVVVKRCRSAVVPYWGVSLHQRFGTVNQIRDCYTKGTPHR
jgi:hypothetical protein